MCLTLKNANTKSKIAEEDIVVYKRLIEVDFPKPGYHGKEFTARFCGRKCSGVISEQDGDTYFCMNSSYAGRTKINEMFNYRAAYLPERGLVGAFHSVIVDEVSVDTIKKLITPYHSVKIEIGNTYNSALKKIHMDINEGLHSFKHLSDAIEDGDGVYVQCVIPKGSKYYEGIFIVRHSGVGYAESYASNKLTYVKIVKKS